MSRAERMAHKARMMARAIHKLRTSHRAYGDTPEVLERIARHRADNFSICSCHMCRNQRRSALSKGDERLTMQERKANEMAAKLHRQFEAD